MDEEIQHLCQFAIEFYKIDSSISAYKICDPSIEECVKKAVKLLGSVNKHVELARAEGNSRALKEALGDPENNPIPWEKVKNDLGLKGQLGQ